jgi:cyclohexanecarboxylate-CoA ligase
VMHSANTLMANILAYAERLRLGKHDVVLMASPMAHQTGFMYGLMMPIMLRASAVLQDVWDATKAADLIRQQGVTFTMASTPFLTDLTRVVSEAGSGVPTLKTFLCAGAPIPGPLVEQARGVLGAKIVSAWGMTENGAVTSIKLEDDDLLAFTTDGCALAGVEVKVIDDDGKTLPPGKVGRLLVRSCSNFGGYLATAMEQYGPRGLVRYWRPRSNGLQRLHPHQRPQQGRHHPGWREHTCRRGRVTAL